MSELKGYEVLCQAFVAEGVDTMFALLGDANMYWGAMMAQKFGGEAASSLPGYLTSQPRR